MKLTEKLNKIWSKMTTVKATTKNYTDEQVKHMVELYSANPNRATVDALAEELGKSVRSIIAKLSREGVYVAQERQTKSGEPVVRKADLVDMLEQSFGHPLPSLVKASKADLTYLVETIIK